MTLREVDSYWKIVHVELDLLQDKLFLAWVSWIDKHKHLFSKYVYNFGTVLSIFRPTKMLWKIDQNEYKNI